MELVPLTQGEEEVAARSNPQMIAWRVVAKVIVGVVACVTLAVFAHGTVTGPAIKVNSGLRIQIGSDIDKMISNAASRNCTEAEDKALCESELNMVKCVLNSTITACCAKEPEAMQARSEFCELKCGSPGDDCSKTQCCDDQTRDKCFKKNDGWATCKRHCDAGENDTNDPEEHRTPWNCSVLSTHAHDPTCSFFGEDCIQSKCCFNSSHQCYKKNEYWAACREKDTCVAGENFTNDTDSLGRHDPVEYLTPWTCQELS